MFLRYSSTLPLAKCYEALTLIQMNSRDNLRRGGRRDFAYDIPMIQICLLNQVL